MAEIKVALDVSAVSGKAELTVVDDVISARFSGTADSYIVSYTLPEIINAVGLVANLHLRNWLDVKYVALGYMVDGVFRHIKAKNFNLRSAVDFRVHHKDVIWQLENPALQLNCADISNVRFFIKGTPGEHGASLDINDLRFIVSSENDTSICDAVYFQPDNKAMAVISNYLKHSFRNYIDQSEHYLATGACPMPGGKALDWPLNERQPGGISEVSTFRFGWHGLHPAINLMLYAQQHNHIGALMAARSFIEQWLNDSFYQVDADKKYAWYDHGTAERLLAFLVMRQLSAEYQCDKRFMQRLDDAIYQHAELLASEAFYAYNQPARYHNHAWFQDAALIAATLCLKQHPRAKHWLNTAILRFEDQLDTLIVRDGGFAIFVENSIGYHHGVQRLAAFAGELVALSGRNTEIPQIAQELIAWSDFLRYPDGRAPAQGDTFRLPPRTGKDVRIGKAWQTPGCTVLPKAGYAVIKGNHDNKPWMLCMFNTSLSATHKHEDNLHLTLWFDGVEWLIDPSFYSHEYLEEPSAFLRGAKAHNGMHIDGQKHNMSKITSNIQASEGTEFGFWGEHSGCYGDSIQRKVDVVGSNRIKIDDAFFCIESERSYKNNKTLNFIFPENVTANVDGNVATLYSKDSGYNLVLSFSNGKVIEKAIECNVGVGFMQMATSQSINVTVEGLNNLSWDITFVKKPKASNAELLSSLKPNVALIGSCVSRDALQFLQCSNITYFARTSLISLASSPIDISESDLNCIPGSFERRMVFSDFTKTALRTIPETLPDFIILDFIDERFDVCAVGDSFVTRSNYMLQAFSDDPRFSNVLKKKNLKSVWYSACEKVLKSLDEINVPIILHKAWWSEKYMNHDSGKLEKFSDAELALVKENNSLLSFYYDSVINILPRVLIAEVEQELVYSDFAHKWGKDYFHYSKEYYLSLIKSILTLIKEDATGGIK